MEPTLWQQQWWSAVWAVETCFASCKWCPSCWSWSSCHQSYDPLRSGHWSNEWWTWLSLWQCSFPSWFLIQLLWGLDLSTEDLRRVTILLTLWLRVSSTLTMPRRLAERIIDSALWIISDRSVKEKLFSSFAPDSTNWRKDANGRWLDCMCHGLIIVTLDVTEVDNTKANSFCCFSGKRSVITAINLCQLILKKQSHDTRWTAT